MATKYVDTLPQSLQAHIAETRAQPRTLRVTGRKHPPDDLFETLRDNSLKYPENSHLAAIYGVDEDTWNRWRREDPRIDIIRNAAEAVDLAEVSEGLRTKALAGNAQAAREYVKNKYPHRVKDEGSLNITTVNVLPAPLQKGDIPTPVNIIDHPTPTKLCNTEESPTTSKSRTQKTPLFGGKDYTVPDDVPQSSGTIGPRAVMPPKKEN